MATMQQVADRANVSISTVSFVINDTKPVLPTTRQRVLNAIDELGYRPNAVARALAVRRTRVICLVLPLTVHDLSTFVQAATATAREHGYNLMLWPVYGDDAAAEVSSLIQTGVADGVLLLEVQLDDERVSRLRRAQAPFALIGRTRDTGGIDYVDIDFERSTVDALGELVGLGHRRICLVIEDFDATPLSGYGPPVRVEETFRRAAADLGVHGAVIRVPRDEHAEEGVAERVLVEAPGSTAVLVMHDRAGVRLPALMRNRGIRVPDDLSIVALAVSRSTASLADPRLVTWDGPGPVLGREATAALISRLEGHDGSATQLLVPCDRIDGDSVAPPPGVARLPA